MLGRRGMPHGRPGTPYGVVTAAAPADAAIAALPGSPDSTLALHHGVGECRESASVGKPGVAAGPRSSPGGEECWTPDGRGAIKVKC